MPFFSSANEGVWINATRVVYIEGDLSKSLGVNNASEKRPYLIRSWVVDENGKNSNWVVTPPIYKIKEKGSLQLRITATDTNNLPKEYESIFYINVLAIPGEESDKDSINPNEISGRLNFAVNTKLKVFYRPDSLSDKKPIEEYKKIKFIANDTNLKIDNPSPFYINFSTLKVDGIEVKNDEKMIKPFSSLNITTKKKTTKVVYSVINDFGGETQRISVTPEG